MSQPKKKKKGKGFIIILIVLIAIVAGVYFALPNDKRKNLFESLGIENSDFVIDNEFESFIQIRNVSSRQAMIGDDWIIKGKIFNTHEEKDLTKVTLMFNFSDGVETVSYVEVIRAGNTVGRKFKERISGHGDAEFESIKVIEAE